MMLIEPDINIQMKQQKIPRLIWQTWSCNLWTPNILQVKSLNPEYKYKLYTDEDMNHFMKYELNWTEASDAYFMINEKIGAARADLWRYCILWKYGGIYIDIDAVCYEPFRDLIDANAEAVLSHETEKFALQWLLAFTAKHLILTSVIQSIIQKILKPDKILYTPLSRLELKELVLNITGPTIFSNAVKKHINMSGIVWQGTEFDGRCDNKNKNILKDAISVSIQYLWGHTKYTRLINTPFLNKKLT